MHKHNRIFRRNVLLITSLTLLQGYTVTMFVSYVPLSSVNLSRFTNSSENDNLCLEGFLSSLRAFSLSFMVKIFCLLPIDRNGS